MPDPVGGGPYRYRAVSQLEVDSNWGTWLGERKDEEGRIRAVVLKHTGEGNRTRAGADALWLEALLAQRLAGPQVVPLLDFGVMEGRPFSVFEYEDGVFLAEVLDALRSEQRALPAGVAVGIAIQVGELIARLHGLSLIEGEPGGWVHGALCPRNLVLTERGDVRVSGLIGVRAMGRIVGEEHVPAAALPYASPELLAGEPVGAPVDIHALGMVLSDMLGAPSAEEPELAGLVRDMLSSGPTGGVLTMAGFLAALRELVQRTGDDTGREAIGAHVAAACGDSLAERRGLVQQQLATEWPAEVAQEAGVQPWSSAMGGPEWAEEDTEAMAALEPLGAEAGAAGSPEVEARVSLAHYDDEAADDAVTEIYQGTAEEHAAEVAAAEAAVAGPPPVPASAFEPAPIVEPSDTDEADPWMASENLQSEVTAIGRARPGRKLVLVALVSALGVALLGAFALLRSGDEAGKSAVAGSLRGDPEQPAAAAGQEAPEAERADGVGGTGLADAGRAPEPLAVDSAATDEDEDEVSAGERSESAGEAEEAQGLGLPPERAGRTRRAARRRRRRRARTGNDRPRAASAGSGEAAEALVLETPRVERPADSEGAAPGLVIEDGPGQVAFLSVDSSPYATLYLDGRKEGVTPMLGYKIEPGPHRLVAKTEDGRLRRLSLLLEAGKTEKIKLTWDEDEEEEEDEEE